MQEPIVPIILSAKQVLRLVGKRDLLIVDTRPFGFYQKGHIPGAVNLALMYFHWSDTSPAGIREFNRQMERVLGFTGVGERTHVVFYEDTTGMAASRGVWLLHYLGHSRASLLDGGLRAWKRAGYKMSTETIGPKPRKFRARVHPEILATMDQVHGSLRKNGTEILDVRSPEEFDGTWVRAARGGHIPGSGNLNWERAVTPQGTFKPLKQLERLYREAGVSKEKEVIAYCQGGYRAAQAYIVLKLLGYPRVRNYLGSWFEWGNDLSMPVEK